MMFKRIYKIIFVAIGALAIGAGFSLAKVPDVQAATNLNGRILLQVQDKGQAWYVDPVSSQRYYLGRPADAFSLMRQLGLGISNTDFSNFKSQGVPARLNGRILLQVQDKGQAWYVDPTNGHMFYLGRPADAFSLMRQLGLGITNQDLSNIKISPNSPTQPITAIIGTGTSTSTLATTSQTGLSPVSSIPGDIIGHWIFKYQNKSYEIFQDMSTSLYHDYASSSKVYVYNQANPPSDLRNAFYGMFLQARPGDLTLDTLVGKLKAIATQNNWSDDQMADFTMALIQYIPYDQAKLSPGDNRNTDPYYPYETLYLDRGVCSDKTFLAVSLLRKLGYGAAILDFPDINHSAVGIECPKDESINGSGYCYGETTNYFPLGVIPQNIDSSGQVQPSSSNPFSNLFDPSGLGTIEIYQKTTGKSYQEVASTRQKVAQLAAAQNTVDTEKQEIQTLNDKIKSEEDNLNSMKAKMDSYYQSGQISEYNAMVSTYNSLVAQFNSDLSDYQSKVATYNTNVTNLNKNIDSFYQR